MRTAIPGSSTPPPPTAPPPAGSTASRSCTRTHRAHHRHRPAGGQSRLPRHRLPGLGGPPGDACDILPQDYPLTCFSLTGYSGGGKKMIAQYEAADKAGRAVQPPASTAPSLQPQAPARDAEGRAGWSSPPVFCPVVDDYYKGMATTVHAPQPLSAGASPRPRRCATSWRPTTPASRWCRCAADAGKPAILYANALAGTDRLELVVSGHEEQTIVTALLRQPGQGRLRRGGAEHEPDAGL